MKPGTKSIEQLKKFFMSTAYQDLAEKIFNLEKRITQLEAERKASKEIKTEEDKKEKPRED